MRVGLIAALMTLGIAGSTAAQHGGASPFGSSQPAVQRSLPVSTLQGFVENRGQWPDDVRYFARLNGIEATLLNDALVFRPQPDRETGEWAPPLILRLPCAATAEGEGALPTPHHYILGTGTTSYVPGFERVVYRDVAPGINLVVRTDADHFAYDLLVQPGAKLEDLVLEVEGAESMEVEDGSVLAMQTPAGRVEQRIGASWQVDAGSGASTPVSSQFRLLGSAESRMQIGFEAPGRDSTRAFVLDPSLVWATYVGGVNQELLRDMHVAADGAVYIAAKSNSTGPTTPGAFMPVKPGGSNAWVGKISPDGTTLEWATFLGGAATEDVVGVDVDQDGSVVVVGNTFSTDFPTTPGSLQPTFGGGNDDIFVSRLASDGSVLVWSTFYGGSDFELADSSALFPAGDVLIAGDIDPFSTDPPPATPGAYDTVFDSGDVILVRISADGTQLAFQTYFSSGIIHDIVCGEDSAIFLGGSAGDELPATPGAYKETLVPGDTVDGFLAKMDPMGSQLFWATYLGGDDLSDHVVGIAVDAASAVYAVGNTESNDFPVTPGAFDTSATAPAGGFATKLLAGGTGLVWSTYLEACCNGTTSMSDETVDSAGNLIVVGSSNAANFPTTPDAYQPTFIGSFPASDAHLTKLDAFGETLLYSTYFGGSQTDYLSQVCLDAAQDPYLGVTAGAGVPVTPGAYDTSYANNGDTVVAKFDLSLLPWQVLGGGLAGAVDTPNLAGSGVLIPGSLARFSVRGAAPSASASIIAGLSAINVPLKGGTLVPAPTVILPLTTNAQGALDLPFTWVSVPAGINIWVQVWIKDPFAPTGFAATNALRMTSQ